ncbi:MAG: hypothetical protein KA757_06160 [Vogesella sp.]|nr:hypothetical protein [Vogesella sp.]
MITIITGAPGTGKTAYLVNLLLNGENKDRPLYVYGVTDLKLPHNPFPAIENETKDNTPVHHWHEIIPDGALVVIDECQKHFRPRGPSAKVPDYISEFETHRHRGLDFILVTQGTHLVDSNLRALIARHIHLKKTILGRYSYEWAECKNEREDANLSKAVRKKYKLPSKAFAQYKSSELHTQVKISKPWQFYALFVFILMALFLFYRVYASFTAKFKPDELPKIEQGGAAGRPAVGAPVASGAAFDASAPVSDFTPRDASRPETAPAYDEIRVVKVMPWPDACVASASRCSCYTGQGTRLDMPESSCREVVANGRFNPYQEPVTETSPQVVQGDALQLSPSNPFTDSPATGGVPSITLGDADKPNLIRG